MPDMPEVVSKGPMLKRLDANSRNPAWLQQVLNDLMSSTDPDVAQIAQNHGVVVTADEKNHLNDDWFKDWWPDAQPVRPIIAEGFRVAITEALNRSLPLDCYWVCHPGHEELAPLHHGERGGEGTVEVSICWSEQQVTVLMHTPGEGRLSIPAAPLTIDESIKVVKRIGGATGTIVTRQPKHRA